MYNLKSENTNPSFNVYGGKVMQTKINQAIKEVLEQFGEKYFMEGQLNKSKVIQDLDAYDKDLLSALIKNETIKDNFTIEINGHIVLQTNKLIELFEVDEYWQDSYTKYSKKIGLTAGGKFIDESTDVVLDFPYKDTILKASMSKEDTDQDDLRPDEPFLNEVIAKEEIDVLLDKKILVNAKKYDEYGVHEIDRFDENDNLIIKGNNLLALHTIKERYAGKVKLIYIDPPYNTGNDSFKYNDKFNQSTWLTFMKNRLEVAKDLLREDGVIFVHVDRNEFAELKILMDEIFDKQYLGTIVNVSTPNGRDYGAFAQTHDYIHVYAKRLEKVKTNALNIQDLSKFKLKDSISYYYLHPLFNSNSAFHKGNRPNLYYPFYVDKNKNDEGYHSISLEKDEKHTVEVYPPVSKTDGTQFVWRWGKEKALKNLNVNIVAQKTKDGSFRIVQKMRPQKKLPRTVWQDTKFSTRRGTEELQKLFSEKVFDYPKPESLLKKIIEIGSNEGEIILDFHMGSATTQAVAMKMNRRFIGIEQMDYIHTVSIPRLQKVIEGEQGGISKNVGWQGGGSFVYVELMEKNRGFLKAIRDAKTPADLRKVFDFMLEEADIDFRVDLEKVKDTLHELSFKDQKKLLFKIIDKNQLYYNYSEIDDENVRDLISDHDYAFNKSFYEGKGE